MKTIFAAASALLLMSAPAFAAPSCAKGAVVGALGGHMVGSGHAVAGAAAGCALGSHERSKAEKEQARLPQQAPTSKSNR